MKVAPVARRVFRITDRTTTYSDSSSRSLSCFNVESVASRIANRREDFTPVARGSAFQVTVGEFEEYSVAHITVVSGSCVPYKSFSPTTDPFFLRGLFPPTLSSSTTVHYILYYIVHSTLYTTLYYTLYHTILYNNINITIILLPWKYYINNILFMIFLTLYYTIL